MWIQSSCQGLCGYQRWITLVNFQIPLQNLVFRIVFRNYMHLSSCNPSVLQSWKIRTISKHVTGLAGLITWITFGITVIYCACQAEPKQIAFLLDSFMTTKLAESSHSGQNTIIWCLAATAPNCPNDWGPPRFSNKYLPMVWLPQMQQRKTSCKKPRVTIIQGILRLYVWN